ncbi:DUF4142 domain-containing protein [Siccirubricoccus sp. KC 17139]|uniref:DUF4142 domain-containing protein n=1 Tax=Siccirubricoccus soli TaxID=2899147 RepID=A0ABT1CZ13_9PROT|nr:DUF4142 domain-containing protein [Siccirubricoccus soli]MCO6414913.1 DUF4142 domain-containing protein [Siccirubricoccus soli]MCP2681043.1 DUF4142 domain-containing protein [Siccirubricoccus soli]
MTRLALLASAALLAALPAAAQTQQQRAQAAQGQNAQSGVPGARDTTTPSATGNRAEAVSAEEFVRLASMSDRFEIASSRLAIERTQTPRVREFAQHMIRDHEKTTAELQRLRPEVAAATAAPRGASPGPGAAGSSAAGTSTGMAPAQGGGGRGSGLDQQHLALLQQLDGAPAAQFEQVYIRQQLQAHQQAVDLFRNYAASGEDAKLREWASATLPSLEEHLRLARQMQQGG